MTAFINALMEGLKQLIKSPVHGLQAFAQIEVEVVDRPKLVADMDKAAEKQEEQEEEGPEVIQHEHHHKFDDDDDEDGWRKAHKEQFGPG